MAICIWHGPFEGTIQPTYTRIDSFLTGGYQPEFTTERKNSLSSFNLEFRDKDFGNIITFKTGDDIVVTEDETGTKVKDGWAAGKINEYGEVPNPVMERPDPVTGKSRKIKIHPLVIEQRDFSGKPFLLEKLSPVMLFPLVKEILQEHTRSDLGGVINGVVIEKVIMLCPDKELANYPSFQGIAIEHVKNAVINRAGYKFYLNAFSELSEVYGLNRCYQLVIDK